MIRLRAAVLASALLLAAPSPLFQVAHAARGEVTDVPMDEPLADLADELGPPGPKPASEAELDALTLRVSKGLRCPVCQGSSIADSPVDSAVNMRRRVRQLLEQGYDQDQINSYFATRYGEWVLQSPPAAGLNWIVWIGPALGGGLALAVLAGVALRWRKEPDEVPLPSDVGDTPLDRYEQRLLDEIER